MKDPLNLCKIGSKWEVWSIESVYCCTNSMLWDWKINVSYPPTCYCISSDYGLSGAIVWTIICCCFDWCLKYLISGSDERVCYIPRSLMVPVCSNRTHLYDSQPKGIGQHPYYRAFIFCAAPSWPSAGSRLRELYRWSQSPPTTHASWRSILSDSCYSLALHSNSTRIDQPTS